MTWTVTPTTAQDPAFPAILAEGLEVGPINWAGDRWWRLDRDGEPVGLLSARLWDHREAMVEHVVIRRSARAFTALGALWRGALAALAAQGVRRVCIGLPVDRVRWAHLARHHRAVVYAAEGGRVWWAVDCPDTGGRR